MIVRHEAVYVRRRRVALAMLAVFALLLVLLADRVIVASRAGASTRIAARPASAARPTGAASHSVTPTSTPSTSASGGSATVSSTSSTPISTSGPTPSKTSPSVSSSTSAAPRAGAAGVLLAQVKRIGTGRTAASVVAAPTGGVFAQAAGDRHSVTAYLAGGGVAATISDTVDLGKFGVQNHPGLSLGAPAAAAFDAKGRYAYIANTSMTGSGFPGSGSGCSAKDRAATSYLYRVGTQDLAVDKVLPAGGRPAAVAVTPDGSAVLSADVCPRTLSVVDAASGRQRAAIALPGTPTAVASSPDGRSAYVAVTGSGMVRVDLRAHTVRVLARTGSAPVALALSRDGSRLFVADRSGTVAQVDTGTGKVVRSVSLGSKLSALALSTDGTALYAAGSGSSSKSKSKSTSAGTSVAAGLTTLASSDLAIQQQLRTPAAAVGVAYEPARQRVWVALSGGSILVLGRAAGSSAG